ncbi:MAG: hypothetical protein LBG28_11820 [Tannerella sp.]|jgi:hypothetical protein|nr:hypothetical protein [Tannerella sp.]
METYNKIPNVNAHLHTPYSFSAFEKLTDALDRAADENVNVVGINDFYSTDGYEEWDKEARKRHLYPLFNIEFISLQKEDQDSGIRVNDPNNPGRTYISGKGLSCPPSLKEPYASQLAGVRAESNMQVKEMCDRVNLLLNAFDAGFSVDFENVENFMAKGLVRERHLAKALRMYAYIHFKNEPTEIKDFLEKIFNGKTLKSDIFDYAGVENEIRSNLLKAGGAAFVPEDPKTFLPLEDVCNIIIAAGGIPAYPFLGDDANGEFTDFERDIESAMKTLKRRRIFSVEFITTRNSMDVLEKYASYFHDNGFVVTFGTEHNTPAMEPVLLHTRGNMLLTDRLKQINYDGACVIAAHQELVRNGKTGYIDANGNADADNRDKYIKMGNELIQNTAK